MGGTEWDAVVVGSGPNGLAAGVELGRAGWRVLVVEAGESPGGGMRSSGALTSAGFVHDICSAVHPLALGSKFFRAAGLERFGLRWIHPEFPLAHPLDGGRAAVQHRGVEETAAGLGAGGAGWRKTFGFGEGDDFFDLLDDILGPLRFWPKRPLLLARFGVQALRPARGFARARFESEDARALFAGIAAHSILPLDRIATSAAAMLLGLSAHRVGWPIPEGGSQAIANALVRLLESLGGKVECGVRVRTRGDLPSARAYLFDTGPRAMAEIAGDRLPAGYRERMRQFRYGAGVFKLDLALSDPIPWEADACRRAGTVHCGGTLEEICESEAACWEGRAAESPFVLVAQPSVFDATRAPEGKHTCWAYCHVPHGWDGDMTDAIERQIERFAPGFRDTILARHAMSARDIEAYNPNYVGGDIIGGVQDLVQTFARPTARLDPYATPAPDIFLCSSSTPPGGGVHGMCGYHAARSVLKRLG